jgi:hypothetical protein
LAVERAALTVPLVEDHLATVAALSHSVLTGYLVLAGVGTLLFLVGLVQTLRRRLVVPRVILTFGSVLGAAMMLTGSVPWAGSGAPGLVLGVAVLGWSLVLTAAALALGHRLACRPPSRVRASRWRPSRWTQPWAVRCRPARC